MLRISAQAPEKGEKEPALGKRERTQRRLGYGGGIGFTDLRKSTAGLGQGDDDPPAIMLIATRLDKPAAQQPFDYALDGRRVHGGEPPEVVLRAASHFLQLGEDRPLGGGRVIADRRGEQAGMALACLAQQETNL